MSSELSQEIKKILAFSPEAEAELSKIISKYPNLQAALLPCLRLAQEEFGYLSVEAMEYVAERLKLPPSKVLQVATFYTMYAKKPIGRHWIEVCTSVPCCMMGGPKLVRYLESNLGISVGQTTKDGKFTITEAECLAACGRAPVMQINSMYYERLGTIDDKGEMHLDTARIDSILDGFK